MGLELQFGLWRFRHRYQAWTSLKFNIWIGVTQILVLGKVYDISGAREILSSKITNATVIQGIKNIKKYQESECIFHKKFKTSREEKWTHISQTQIFPNNNQFYFPDSLIT